LLFLLLLPSLSHGPGRLHQRAGRLHRLPGLGVPLSQLLKNGPHSLRDVLVQRLAQEWSRTRRLCCLRCPRLRRALRGLRLLRWLRGALLDLGPLVLLRLLHRLRQLGNHSALLIKDIGRGRILLVLWRLPHRLRRLGDYPATPIKVNHRKVPFDSAVPQLGAHPALLLKDTGRGRLLRCCFRLRGLGRLLLLFVPPLWTGRFHRLPGLRVPLSQLLKNGAHGLRDALVQRRAQERPGTARLLCLRGLRPRGALRGAGLLVLLR
jgi:hypothetical protein